MIPNTNWHLDWHEQSLAHEAIANWHGRAHKGVFTFYRNDTEFLVSPRSYKPVWSVVAYRQARHALPVPLFSYRNETSYLLYIIPVQNVVKSHTGTNVSYRYENRSELVPVWLVPVWHFVPVSCKRIQSCKWEPGWTRTGMKLVPVSCKHPQSVMFASSFLYLQLYTSLLIILDHPEFFPDFSPFIYNTFNGTGYWQLTVVLLVIYCTIFFFP